jgi:hypothetical protein
MPLTLSPADYERWVSDEPDPADLLRPFPAEPMRMWPISTRVNKPENDDLSIIEPIDIVSNTHTDEASFSSPDFFEPLSSGHSNR